MNGIISTLKEYAQREGLSWNDEPDNENLCEFDSGLYYRFPMPLLTVCHAYHPGAKEIAQGGEHLVFNYPYHAGRLHREPGQALCSPRRFWGLYPIHGHTTCPRCREMATRYGLTVARQRAARESEA